MAIDEAIFQTHQKGGAPPTLRVYQWSEVALSLGRHQPLRDINIEECRRQNITLVRRPTGGRAVLHLNEFTYSLVVSSEFGIPSSISEAYKFLSRGLLEALVLLGLPAEMGSRPARKPIPAACFASATRSDILCGGRKVVGSAQRRQAGTLLQQGSLTIRSEAELLFSLLNMFGQDRKLALDQYLDQTTSLEEMLGKPVGRENIVKALRMGFEKALGWSFEEGGLSHEETAISAYLEESYQKV